MSEKVTFQELIESIAEESDNTKQFTHDFLKDFVDVINNGLEQDGNVSIAGFGKFKLRHVTEREGYNPQTEEKMTIPAHNKVVFKPYKGVRELVNAPYAHLESELIETDESEDTTTEPTPKEDDTSEKSPSTSEESTEKTTEEKYREEDPFGFEAMSSKPSSKFSLEEGEEVTDEEEDIVEFKAETTEEQPDESAEDLEEFIGATQEAEEISESREKSDKQQEEITAESNTSEPIEAEDKEAEPSNKQIEESPFAPMSTTSDEESTDSDDQETQKDDRRAFDRKLPDRKSSSSLPLVVAAISILVLLAVGAWYFGMFSTNNPSQLASQKNISSAKANLQQGPNQETPSQKSSTNNRQQSQKTNSQKQSAQNQTTSNKSQQATNTNSSASQKREQHAITKGQTLWSIAEDKYGNPRLWPWIYGNNGSLNDPDLIIAGSSLAVPLPSGPRNNLTSSDSVGVAKGFLSTYQWYKKQDSPKAKNHLWGAKVYHSNIKNLADIPIDEADLSYANKAQ
ncbi:HU family DNA-binding protein [Fodinibius saliphilus]|uniref:HU family DNA-binding protein n=1 Tax=Fodinibius saliphilus TaxID=1920650 RepID=UPI001109B526|nr:HU family DNA-binding protein [Fodinibius saliphilus]